MFLAATRAALTRVSLTDGDERPFGPPGLAPRGGLSLSPAGDDVYVGTASGLTVLDARDGRVRFELELAGDHRARWATCDSQSVLFVDAGDGRVLRVDVSVRRAVSLERVEKFSVRWYRSHRLAALPEGRTLSLAGNELVFHDADGQIERRLLPHMR